MRLKRFKYRRQINAILLFMKPALLSLRKLSKEQLTAEIVSGAIVGIVALPLAIAFGIASGVAPEKGLYTAIVAGFLISALGGSRVQIGGPTGAFVVIVYGIVQKHGIEGLAIATVLAGLILIAMGLLKLGTVVRFIPYPVVTGFTSGIAAIIFSTQINDFFGLGIKEVPSEFFAKWATYIEHAGTINVQALFVSLLSLSIILLWPRRSRKIPSPFAALVISTAAVFAFNLNVETLGSRYGEIKASLPAFNLPDITIENINILIWPAVIIAVLAAVESLLSAVVADGMIEDKHDSNMELVAQGIANIASPLFGGMPATGALARTATNVKNGGRTPIAGITHTIVLLLILLAFGKFVAFIPIAALSAILVVVSYHMSEYRMFKMLAIKAPKEDAYVLLITFLLTVFVDLTVGVTVGMVFAVLLLIKKLVLLTEVEPIRASFKNGAKGKPTIRAHELPKGVEVYEIRGPFFFGAVYKFRETVDIVAHSPKVLILNMRKVFAIDATGLNALEGLINKAKEKKTIVMLSGIYPEVFSEMEKFGLIDDIGRENIFKSVPLAIKRAEELLEPKSASQ